MLFTPSSFHTLYFVSQCYSFNSSQHPHLCFLENLFLLLSNCPTFCSIPKYWSNDSHVDSCTHSSMARTPSVFTTVKSITAVTVSHYHYCATAHYINSTEYILHESQHSIWLLGYFYTGICRLYNRQYTGGAE